MDLLLVVGNKTYEFGKFMQRDDLLNLHLFFKKGNIFALHNKGN